VPFFVVIGLIYSYRKAKRVYIFKNFDFSFQKWKPPSRSGKNVLSSNKEQNNIVLSEDTTSIKVVPECDRSGKNP